MPGSYTRISVNDQNFPPLLRQIPGAPKEIYIYGNTNLDMLGIAIVGTRNATPSGKETAWYFSRSLSEQGCVIISGLAFGIDAAAHTGCLDAGGRTIAVLPCGIDQIYPRSNAQIAERIVKSGGTLISEYPPGTEALPYRFLERNRIVSGLAQGVVVIEAPEKSGALRTARFAAEQGRECFVVPGPIDHPNFAGSHELIRKGAELVTKPEHILEAFGMIKEDAKMPKKIPELSSQEAKIFDYLSSTRQATEIDKIITTVNVEPQVANVALTMLIVKGLIKETAEGYMVS